MKEGLHRLAFRRKAEAHRALSVRGKGRGRTLAVHWEIGFGNRGCRLWRVGPGHARASSSSVSYYE